MFGWTGTAPCPKTTRLYDPALTPSGSIPASAVTSSKVAIGGFRMLNMVYYMRAEHAKNKVLRSAHYNSEIICQQAKRVAAFMPFSLR